MANKPNSKRQITRSVEIALVSHLLENGIFKKKNCAVIEKTENKAAPESTPYITVHCTNVTRTPDTSLEMYSKTANVVVTLVVESVKNQIAQFENLSRDMECLMEDLPTMRKQFNKPTRGKDTRPIRGLHLHYIDEFQTDDETDGLRWQFGVGCSLIMDQVSS